MSNYDLPFWQDVTEILRGVEDAPIWRLASFNKFNWQNQIEAGNLPETFWVVACDEPVEEDLLSDSAAYRYPMHVMYCRPSKLTPAENLANTTIVDVLEAVTSATRDAFRAYTGSNFQLMGRNPVRAVPDSWPAADVYQALQAKRGVGAIHLDPLVGEYD